MIYVMSDLHGRYDLYRKMLERIKLSADDTLYILGDFVDRGPDGFKMIFDMSERKNIVPIMGNHDLIAETLLRGFFDEAIRDDDMEGSLQTWFMDGGGDTYTEFRALSRDEQRLALGLMDEFRNYATVTVGDMRYILCHAGIDGYVLGKPLAQYNIMNFAFGREDYSRPKIGSPTVRLVTGHTPTVAIEGAERGRIFRSHDHIAIDCGAVFGYGLGCLCLDTNEEFYVT